MRPDLADGLNDPGHPLVGGPSHVPGPWQLEAMRRIGTRPHHRTLDLDCGALRSEFCISEHPERPRHVRIEPNPSLQAVAHGLASSSGLTERGVALGSLGQLIKLGRFDRVMTRSVLHHLDRDGIAQVVVNVARLLQLDGWWLGTALFDDAAAPLDPGPSHPFPEGKRVWSRVDERWLSSLLEANGLSLARMTDLPHPGGLSVFAAHRRLTDRALALLSHMVALDTSQGGAGVGAMVEHLSAHLGTMGFEVEVISVQGGSPLLVARRGPVGGGGGRAVLYNHYDAVGCGVDLVEHEGRIFGPGVGDNKGPLATRMTALGVAPMTPALLWLIQGEEESGSAIARTVFRRLCHEVDADVFIDEAGWHDPDGTQRVLACTLDVRGNTAPPDDRLNALSDFLRTVSPTPIRTEARTLDKRLVPGGCAFREALPSGARYLSIGPLDSKTRIHSPGESISRARLEPSMTQFISLLRWLAT